MTRELKKKMKYILEANIELLASVEHESWSHWQRYMHSQAERAADGSISIPSELVTRWERQMSTPYDDLSETEKESDREQVRKMILRLLDLFQ